MKIVTAAFFSLLFCNVALSLNIPFGNVLSSTTRTTPKSTIRPTVDTIFKNSSCSFPSVFRQIDNSMTCIYRDSKNYQDAIAACWAIYAFPACITTPTMLKAVGDFSVGQKYAAFLAGATNFGHPNHWVCANDRNITSNELMWGVHEPTGGGSDNCTALILQGSDYAIGDRPCTNSLPFMCEFSTICSEANPSDFIPVGNYSYCFNHVQKTWNESNAICNAIGGHLACPRNVEINQHLQSVSTARGYDHVFVGLTDQNTRGTFKCWDGTIPIVTEQWSLDQPSLGKLENCAGLTQGLSNNFVGLECLELFYSVCEIPYISPQGFS